MPSSRPSTPVRYLRLARATACYHAGKSLAGAQGRNRLDIALYLLRQSEDDFLDSGRPDRARAAAAEYDLVEYYLLLGGRTHDRLEQANADFEVRPNQLALSIKLAYIASLLRRGNVGQAVLEIHAAEHLCAVPGLATVHQTVTVAEWSSQFDDALS